MVSDEDLVLDDDPFADEGVARDFATPADYCVLLDFDEAPDLGIIADATAVQVRKPDDLHVAAEPHIGRDSIEILHGSEPHALARSSQRRLRSVQHAHNAQPL